MILHQAKGLLSRAATRGRAARSRAFVLGIVSGKGGVGKSALAVNLATAAARTGASTLLIDGDLGLANADLLMGLVPGHDLADCVAGRCRLEDAICMGPAGLELLVAGASRPAVATLARSLAPPSLGPSRAASAAASVETSPAAASSGPFRSSEAERLAERIGRRDLTVLDLGAGIGADVLELARLASLVWLVATPEPTSLADAYTTAKHLWEREPRLRVELVVNRAADRASGERTHRALERLVQRFLGRGLPLRAILPEDPAMIRAVARQGPVVLAEPDSAIARRIGLLAESLLEEAQGSSDARRPEAASSRADDLG